MNLIKVKEQLLEMGSKINLQVEEETKDSLTMHCELTAEQYYDESIYFRVTIFASGTLHVFFTFNERQRTYDNLYLINNFNTEHPWFKAYIGNINNKDYLELHFTSLTIKEENDVIDTIGFLLNDLLDEETLNLLKPILNSDK